VLEIGCGRGQVAEVMADLGHRVTAIDSDPEAMARTRVGAFTFIEASWPDFDGGPFDAVAFTRSLHHIGALGLAIEKAHAVLAPSGVLLVEDFAFDEASEAMLEWFVGVLRSHRARTLIIPREGELVTELIEASDPMAVWGARHDRHDLHSAPTMVSAARGRFEIETMPAPYCYRYLIPVLPETAEAAGFTADVLREESGLGDRGLALIGRRMVGTPRAPSA